MRPSLFLPKIVHLVVGLAEIALVFRIIFRLFAANPDASFVRWIYTTSDTLLQPFRGIFPTALIEKSHVLDFTALFALVAYALIGAILAYLVAVIERAAMKVSKPSKK